MEVVFREILYYRRDDSSLKGFILPHSPVHAKKAGEVGHKILSPYRFGFKICFLFRSVLWQNLEAKVRVIVPRGKASPAYTVVTKWLQGLEGKGNYVLMDNYFCSISLFKDLVLKEIYTTSLIWANRIRLPSHLRNVKAWTRYKQGRIEWAMYKSREISCVM